MTEIAFEHTQKVDVLPFVSKTISTALMAAALVGSLQLLDWAIVNKISKIEVLNPTNITAAVRAKQLDCLAINIYREAGSEPFEGKVGVAQVTLNRADSGQFPKDLCAVVYQKDKIYDNILCQFSWVCERQPVIKPINDVAYKESMEVAKKVLLEGFRLTSLNEAMYFHGDSINPGWRREKVAKIGHHIFYK